MNLVTPIDHVILKIGETFDQDVQEFDCGLFGRFDDLHKRALELPGNDAAQFS